jgi:hypothetical protein
MCDKAGKAYRLFAEKAASDELLFDIVAADATHLLCVKARLLSLQNGRASTGHR